ncbi:MAG: hypothetical protein KAH23_01870 [Kiritimatiellae bacterium]|nr:hypothetical protein [Kiritimatiellia bacterium]
MFKNNIKLLCILGISTLCGCIDVTTIINVKKDGSGVITETTYMGKAAQQMMQQMAAGMGAGMGQAVPSELPIEVEKYKSKAKNMGTGVQYVSAKRVSKTDGSKGLRVLYSFTDIRKIKISSEPETPSPGRPGSVGDKKKDSPVTFGFTKGQLPQLIINMPKPEKSSQSSLPPEMGGEMTPPPDQMAMMKQMFDGFRMRIMVKVDGSITKSNASYIEKDSKSGKKQLITLLDMNIGEIMKDEQMFKKLASMGKIQDMHTAKKMLKDIPGLKIETNEQIKVEFK